MIKSVIYDLDDSLYNFVTTNEQALEKMCREAGQRFGLEPETFRRVYETSYPGILNAMPEEILSLLPEGVGVATMHSRTLRLNYTLTKLGLPILPHAVELYDIYWEDLLANIKPEAHLPETLRKLKERGIRIGIGTNMTARMQYRKIMKLGLCDVVDFIMTSDECLFDKPDPRFFRKTVEKAGCRPDECLFIGDNFRFDYEGARNAGLKALWYARTDKPWNDIEEKKLAQAQARGEIIKDHAEVLRHIGG